MRSITWILTVLLLAGTAEAQSTSAKATADKSTSAAANDFPRWDFGVTAGLFNAHPGNNNPSSYDDDWFAQGRYTASIGRYWTENLKTEFEFATTGEGSRYVHGLVRLPGGSPYSYSSEQVHWINHVTARVVYQFLDNTWVHPWVSAGAVFQADRWGYEIPPEYFFIDPRNPNVPVRPPFNPGRQWDYSAGGSLGTGVKFYVSSNKYINSGLVVSYAKPTTTITLLTGFGIDF
jgi:hypothetical protein